VWLTVYASAASALRDMMSVNTKQFQALASCKRELGGALAGAALRRTGCDHGMTEYTQYCTHAN
jgi:hypothetical protein